MTKSQAEQAVDNWFAGRGWKVFPFQRAVWKAAQAGQSGLLRGTGGRATPVLVPTPWALGWVYA